MSHNPCSPETMTMELGGGNYVGIHTRRQVTIQQETEFECPDF